MPRCLLYRGSRACAFVRATLTRLWTQIAKLLQTLWNACLEPSVLVSETEAALGIPPEQQFAVLRAESPNRRPDVYPGLAPLAYARAGDD